MQVDKQDFDFLVAYLCPLTQSFELAEDIAQDTLVRYIEHVPVIESIAHKRAWLKCVARNTYTDLLRHRIRKTRAELVELRARNPEFPNIPLRVHLQTAFTLLGLDAMHAIQAVLIEGYTAREYATRNNTSTGTIGSIVSRARARLRTYLES